VGNHSRGVNSGPNSSEAVDFDGALEHVDRDDRAEHAGRECVISASDPSHSVPRGSAPEASVSSAASDRFIDGPPQAADGYAQLEQRAKRRRVDGRIAAARVALAQHRLNDASAALHELMELSPDLPILGELTTELNQLRSATSGSRRGPWMAAAAACLLALVAFLVSSSQKVGLLISHPIGGFALPVAPALRPSAVDTSGASPPKIPTIAEPGPPAAAQSSVVVEPRPRRLETIVEQQQTPLVDVASPAVPAPASIPIDDEALIRRTLRSYRDAYNAQSARAIQTTVGTASLARAVDALQTQSIVFDACQMEVRGSSAMAICRGAARFLPKSGKREPRTERRVWSFTLNKINGDWTIETARTDQ
jgi:hypothetical protein